MERYLESVAALSRKGVKRSIIVALLLFLVSLTGIFRIEINTHEIQYFRKNHPIRVATDFIVWREDDGIGRSVRNGLNFTERGFGIRGAVGNPDRGNTAASQRTQSPPRDGPSIASRSDHTRPRAGQTRPTENRTVLRVWSVTSRNVMTPPTSSRLPSYRPWPLMLSTVSG